MNVFVFTGSAQGKNQKEGVLGSERPYLLKQLWGGTPVTITVAPSPPQGPLYKGAFCQKSFGKIRDQNLFPRKWQNCIFVFLDCLFHQYVNK